MMYYERECTLCGRVFTPDDEYGLAICHDCKFKKTRAKNIELTLINLLSVLERDCDYTKEKAQGFIDDGEELGEPWTAMQLARKALESK